MIRKYKYLAGDFETTAWNSAYTEVWASAIVEVGSADVKIFNSISDTFRHLKMMHTNLIVYYHNLKFDGSFWIQYLNNIKYTQAYDEDSSDWIPDYKMPSRSYKYLISSLGQWYFITIKIGRVFIYLRDSLKLLPFKLSYIAESFNLSVRKGAIDYTKKRVSGDIITDEEKEYIKNDVLILSEALNILMERKLTKTTIGANCLEIYKKRTGKVFNNLFPSMESIELPEEYGQADADSYIRKAYKGGWCYLKNKGIYNGGITLDVNSLYPYVMSSDSGNKYPIGLPTFWKGNYIPEVVKDKYYFVRIRCRFYLKQNKLPTIQIKGGYLYRGNEWLKSSDYYERRTGTYYKSIILNGEFHEMKPVLTLTGTDFELLLEHYNTEELEILDGCYFEQKSGIFDDYINEFRKVKENSVGAERQLAKLFLNNLYGKLATSRVSSYKLAYIKDTGELGFHNVEEFKKSVVYIPSGAAVTSYARAYTIKAAQKNYNRFLYADTDSIHLKGTSIDDIKGVSLDNTRFGAWKLEKEWEVGNFVRQKTYIEASPKQNDFNIKCAGMSERCKELFIKSITRDFNKEDYDTEELDFLSVPRTIKDFKEGLIVPGKLVTVQIRGGAFLAKTTFEVKG